VGHPRCDGTKLAMQLKVPATETEKLRYGRKRDKLKTMTMETNNRGDRSASAHNTVHPRPCHTHYCKGPGGPFTSRSTIAPKEAIKGHSHVAQGSEHHFRDRPALIASGGQLLVTIVDEVAFKTGCGNSSGMCNLCRRGGPSSRIDCTYQAAVAARGQVAQSLELSECERPAFRHRGLD